VYIDLGVINIYVCVSHILIEIYTIDTEFQLTGQLAVRDILELAHRKKPEGRVVILRARCSGRNSSVVGR
jgi:hypothetical protein